MSKHEQKRTCSLAGCHGSQTKDISSISTFLKFKNNLIIACKTLGSYSKGYIENRRGLSHTPPPPWYGVWVQNSLAWEGLKGGCFLYATGMIHWKND